jgi:DNA-binding CsgD family transcriptional regulator
LRPKLTSRETDIFELSCQGLSGPEIARRLNISLETVKGYKSRILRKYDARTMTQVVAIHYRSLEEKKPEIILTGRLRLHLRTLILSLEEELSKELVILLREVTKD